MKRLVLVVLALALAGCGGGGVKTHPAAKSTRATVDTATVDQVLTRASHSAHILLHVHGGAAADAAEFALAESDLRLAASQLEPPPAGVDPVVARSAAAAFRADADALAATASCLQQETSSGGCDALSNDTNGVDQAAGRAAISLLPFSTLTQADLVRMSS